MTEALEILIYEACLEAAERLGEDTKKMSCFLNQWATHSPSEALEDNKKAA